MFVMQGVCSDAASFDLTGAMLASALQEVQAAVEVALLKRDGEAQVRTLHLNLPTAKTLGFYRAELH